MAEQVDYGEIDEWDGVGSFGQVCTPALVCRGGTQPRLLGALSLPGASATALIVALIASHHVAQHAVAGSIAGLAEHAVMYPVDTIKTIMQVRQAPQLQTLAAEGAGATASMSASFEHLTASGGVPRMWRGVQTMFTGCVPAHAAYFSIYEGCKARLNRDLAASSEAGAETAAAAAASASSAGVAPSAFASGASVALATMAHDVIMTPMDCIKQRLQLGHHKNSLVECACAMLQQEGPRAFLRSYPTTLLMNVPYALVMGTTNEALRGALNPSGTHSLSTYLAVRSTTSRHTRPRVPAACSRDRLRGRASAVPLLASGRRARAPV
jgi:hypothetical protein